MINTVMKETRNIGDLTCVPTLYFNLGDITDILNLPALLKGETVIVGGGGMMIFSQQLRKIGSEAKVSIAWGIGTNGNKVDYSALDKFSLIGIRDYGMGYEWVPCVSCMSPLFDKYRDVSPTQKVILYENQPTNLPYLKCHNTLPDLESALKVLSCAETVITTSYHGAYWGTLLNRKVIVVNAWSDKFYYMKHKPVITTSRGVDSSLERTTNYPEALQECRSTTLNFMDKVKGVL